MGATEEETVQEKIARAGQARDKDTLWGLSFDPDPGVRVAVVSNPTCPLEVLSSCTTDKSREVIEAIINSPNVQTDILGEIFERWEGCSEVLDLLLSHPRLPQYQREKYYEEWRSQKTEKVLGWSSSKVFIQAHTNRDPGILDRIVRLKGHPTVKFQALHNPWCSARTLRSLWGLSAKYNRAILQHPNCPDDIRSLGRFREDVEVMETEDPDVEIQRWKESKSHARLLLRNPNVPTAIKGQILASYTNDTSDYLRATALLCPNLDVFLVLKLQADSSNWVRQLANRTMEDREQGLDPRGAVEVPPATPKKEPPKKAVPEPAPQLRVDTASNEQLWEYLKEVSKVPTEVLVRIMHQPGIHSQVATKAFIALFNRVGHPVESKDPFDPVFVENTLKVTGSFSVGRDRVAEAATLEQLREAAANSNVWKPEHARLETDPDLLRAYEGDPKLLKYLLLNPVTPEDMVVPHIGEDDVGMLAVQHPNTPWSAVSELRTSIQIHNPNCPAEVLAEHADSYGCERTPLMASIQALRDYSMTYLYDSCVERLQSALQNPKLPATFLCEFIDRIPQDGKHEDTLLMVVEKHPNASHDVHEKVANRRGYWMGKSEVSQYAVETASGRLAALPCYQSSDAFYEALGRNMNLSEETSQKLYEKHPSSRVSLAAYSRHWSVLERAAKDEDHRVREALSLNPNGMGASIDWKHFSRTPQVLSRMARIPKYQVEVALHPRTPDEALHYLSRGGHDQARDALLKNLNLPDEDLRYMSQHDPLPELQEAAWLSGRCYGWQDQEQAWNEHLRTGIVPEGEDLDSCATSSNPKLREKVALSTRCKRQLAAMVRDPNPAVRLAAVNNPNTDIAALKKIWGDSDSQVRQKVVERLSALLGFNVADYSPFDDGWISNNSKCGGSISLRDNARIEDNVVIHAHNGEITISGNAVIREGAKLYLQGSSLLTDNAVIEGEAEIRGEITMRGSSRIGGGSRLEGTNTLSGRSFVGGTSYIEDSTLSQNALVFDSRLVKENTRGDFSFPLMAASYHDHRHDPEVARALAHSGGLKASFYEKLLEQHPDLHRHLVLNPHASTIGSFEPEGGELRVNDSGVVEVFRENRWIAFPSLRCSEFARILERRANNDEKTPESPEPVEAAGEPSAFQVIKDTIANKALSAMASQTVKALGGSEGAEGLVKTAVALASENETVQTMPVADMVSQALNGETP